MSPSIFFSFEKSFFFPSHSLFFSFLSHKKKTKKQVSITKGIQVFLKDRDNKALSRGFNQISQNLNKKVKRKRLSSFDAEKTLSNLHPVTSDVFFFKIFTL